MSISPAPDLFAEIHELVTARIFARITPEQFRRLEHMLATSAEARQVYVAYIQETIGLQTMLGSSDGGELPLGLHDMDDAKAARPRDAVSPLLRRSPAAIGFLKSVARRGGESLAASALTWLVMGVVCSGIIITIFFCIALLFQGAGLNLRSDASIACGRAPDAARGQAAAGAQVTGAQVPGGQVGLPPAGAVSSADSSSPDVPPTAATPSISTSISTVARLVHTYDCRWAIGSHSPRLGDDLAPGRKLTLLTGVAEVMFESGVRAMLQGPATVEIVSRESASIAHGKLTIRVEDADARGFTVYAPGMKYTDLGTEFGVWVAKDGTQEMHVFRGKVRAEPVASSPAAEPPSERARIAAPPLLVEASQAVRVAAAEKAIEPIRCDAKRFVRATFEPAPIAVFGTGIGLDHGALDPHWQLVDISTEQDFKPRPAVVADPPFFYAAGDRETGQWIGRVKLIDTDDMPDGCRMTFRTHFSLNGFVAHTARIKGRISVDDYLAEIRLNGKRLPVPEGSRGGQLFSRWLEFAIDSGFVNGDNTLDIVIENAVLGPHGGNANKMAMCVSLKGTARPWPIAASQE